MRRTVHQLSTTLIIAAAGIGLGYAGAAAVEGARYDRHVQIIEQKYENMCPQEDSCDYVNNQWVPVPH